MVVRMRHTRAHTANRRSHHALKGAALLVCECGATRLGHRACATCGRYRGRVVVDVAAKVQRQAIRKAKKDAVQK
jgi:large subunit ribosomal protein L32